MSHIFLFLLHVHFIVKARNKTILKLKKGGYPTLNLPAKLKIFPKYEKIPKKNLIKACIKVNSVQPKNVQDCSTISNSSSSSSCPKINLPSNMANNPKNGKHYFKI